MVSVAFYALTFVNSLACHPTNSDELVDYFMHLHVVQPGPMETFTFNHIRELRARMMLLRSIVISATELINLLNYYIWYVIL